MEERTVAPVSGPMPPEVASLMEERIARIAAGESIPMAELDERAAKRIEDYEARRLAIGPRRF